MRANKVAAAKRLVETLQTDEDISDYLIDHPSEVCGLEWMLRDMASVSTGDKLPRERSNKENDACS